MKEGHMEREPSEESNTYIIDPESAAEMARLIHLDRFTTNVMGGPLVGVPDLSSLQNVVDLGCGPGGWVLDVAFDLPQAEVAGIDVSRTMVEYANARARTQHLPNASFGVMNIAHPLDFADGAFDLVNARYLLGVLKRDTWPAFLRECTRLLRSGGIVRMTEPIDFAVTTSPAVQRLNGLTYQALWRAGYGYSPDGSGPGMTSVFPDLLRSIGYQEIWQLVHAMEVSLNTPGWIDYYRNVEVGTQLAQPLLLKTGVATQEELDQLYQQALLEMHFSDFRGMWHFMTFLARKPEKGGNEDGAANQSIRSQ